MNVEVPAFEFNIRTVSGPDEVAIRGSVTSPSLDPHMHPRGKVRVFILTKRKLERGKKGFILDSFQLRSLQEYLRIQDYIRQTLERELPVDQEAVDPEGEPVRGDVWSWARVRYLDLRLRDLRNPETFKRYKKDSLDAEA